MDSLLFIGGFLLALGGLGTFLVGLVPGVRRRYPRILRRSSALLVVGAVLFIATPLVFPEVVGDQPPASSQSVTEAVEAPTAVPPEEVTLEVGAESVSVGEAGVSNASEKPQSDPEDALGETDATPEVQAGEGIPEEEPSLALGIILLLSGGYDETAEVDILPQSDGTETIMRSWWPAPEPFASPSVNVYRTKDLEDAWSVQFFNANFSTRDLLEGSLERYLGKKGAVDVWAPLSGWLAGTLVTYVEPSDEIRIWSPLAFALHFSDDMRAWVSRRIQ